LGRRWLSPVPRQQPRLSCPGTMCCWPPSCTCRARGRVLSLARGWPSGWMRGWPVGWCSCAPRPDTARRWRWPTGPGAAGGRGACCRLVRVATNPGRSWGKVSAGARASRGAAERRRPLFGPPPPSSFDGPVTALINELAGQPGDDEPVLILDDYHLIDAGPVHESLSFLAEHLPPGLRLVQDS